MKRRAQLLVSVVLPLLAAGCGGAADIAPEAGAEVDPVDAVPPTAPVAPLPPGPPEPPPRYPAPARPIAHWAPVWSVSLTELVGGQPVALRRDDSLVAYGRAPDNSLRVAPLDLARRAAGPARPVAPSARGSLALLDGETLVDVDPLRHELFAFDVVTMADRWRVDLGDDVCALDRILVADWLVTQLGECHEGLYRPRQLIGIGARDGVVHWRADVDLSLTWGSMWSDGRRVLLTRARGYDSPESAIEALDVLSGERIWSVPLPAASCGASSDGTWVLVDGPDGAREVLRASTGERLRSIAAAVPRCGRQMYGTAPNAPTAAVSNGQGVYFDGEALVQVDLATGAELWRTAGLEYPGPGAMQAVALADDAVVVRQPGDRIVAVDRATGDIAWEWCLPGLGHVRPVEPVPGVGDDRPWLLARAARLWLFERGPRPVPAEQAAIQGRIVAGEGLKQRDVARRAVLIGATVVTTDRRGRFRGRVSARGAVRVELVEGPPQWERGQGRVAIAAEPTWVALDGRASYEAQPIVAYPDPDADG